MKWRNASVDDKGNTNIPCEWLFTHYYEALTVLFRVENALRIFVYLVLKDHYGSKWKELEIQSDEEPKTTINALARRRIEQNRNFGYLSYPIQSPLMHLTSGELGRLITQNSYWPIFKNYFLAARDVVTLKLQEIGTIRNALAHFRPISSNDVEVVKLNANQILSKVEEVLVDILKCSQVVPTNTNDEWYIQLRTLGNNFVTFSFSQSEDKCWIRIKLQYQHIFLSSPPKVKRRTMRYRVTTINAPAIIETQAAINENVLFITERIPIYSLTEELLPEGCKEVGLTFSRQILVKNLAIIKESLESLIEQISEETELLRVDQLAQGNLVNVSQIKAKAIEGEKSSWWSIDTEQIESRQPIQEMPEYWGRIYPKSDFISDTENYPWMPVKVSEVDIPF